MDTIGVAARHQARPGLHRYPGIFPVARPPIGRDDPRVAVGID